MRTVFSLSTLLNIKTEKEQQAALLTEALFYYICKFYILYR